MKLHQRILLHWPLIMSGAFAVFSLVLLWNLQSSQTQLRNAIDARLVAESQRRVATISDFVSELRQAAFDLAADHEIDAYLTNRALGMSPRYGLNTNLEFIEQHFQRTMEQKTLRGKLVYKRIQFLSETGKNLVSVGAPQHRDFAAARSESLVKIFTDTDGTQIVINAPVKFKGNFSGNVVTTIDATILSRLLLGSNAANRAESNFDEFLITDKGASIPARDQSSPVGIANTLDLARIPEGKFIALARESQADHSDGLFALRMGIAGLPLSTITVISETEAYGQLGSSTYSYVLATFLLLFVLAAVGFERMRLRANRLQSDYSKSDRNRSELEQHNKQLSVEMARRQIAESALNSKTEALEKLNADLRIAAAAFDAEESIVIADAKMKVLRVNRAFCKMTGGTADQIANRTTDMTSLIGLSAELSKEMSESIRSTGCWRGEISGLARDGGAYKKWLSISSAKDDNAKIAYYVGTYHDVSERKKAEALELASLPV